MIPDADVPGSPAWWMTLLAKQLAAKQPRLRILDDYWRGRPPLVGGSENAQRAFYKFQRIARSNFASLIVQARRDRIATRAIRTAVGDDENGDAVAWALYLANNMDVQISDLARFLGVFGETYIANAIGRAESQIITAEDPRQTITYEDPATGQTLAGFKLFHDYLADTDYACLWVPGKKYVATRRRKLNIPRQQLAEGPPPPPMIRFSADSFDLLPFQDPEEEHPELVAHLQNYSEEYDFQDIPITHIEDPDGFGLFEKHTDLLDRINHTILQRVVIATLQAFKQRGLELAEGDDLPTHDDQGNKIDYDEIFSADPGALWKLPAGAKIWESTEVDLQGILSSVKDDVLHLAALTQTALSMFTPDAAAQSAEGAQLQREGLVFGVEHMQRLLNRGVARSFAIAFAMGGQAERADVTKISVEWMEAERYSLAERAQADSQAVSLTWAQRQRMIWGQSPDEIQVADSQRNADALLASAQAAAAAPPAPTAPPAPAPAPPARPAPPAPAG